MCVEATGESMDFGVRLTWNSNPGFSSCYLCDLGQFIGFGFRFLCKMGIVVHLSLGLLYGITSVIVYRKLFSSYLLLHTDDCYPFFLLLLFLTFGTAIKCEISHDLKSSNTCNFVVF